MKGDDEYATRTHKTWDHHQDGEDDDDDEDEAVLPPHDPEEKNSQTFLETRTTREPSTIKIFLSRLASGSL